MAFFEQDGDWGELCFCCDVVVCPQCQLDRVEYWCAECDLKFCGTCFKQIHSVRAAKDHRKIATEGLSSYGDDVDNNLGLY